MSPSVIWVAAVIGAVGVAVTAVVGWGRAVLADPERYLRAVAPLTLPVVGRAAALLTIVGARRRGVGRTPSLAAAFLIRRSATAAWAAPARRIAWRHLHRRARLGLGPTVVVVGTAAVGELLGAPRRLRYHAATGRRGRR